MDKAILKKFAIESRQDLMEKIKNKINTFYVDEEFKNEQKGELYILSNEKHSLSLTHEEYKKRELLIKRIKELSLEQVIEEAAYTWFNRIIAIRYMEINDMLPLTRDNQSLGIRVLSSKDNTPDPEILKFTNLMNPDLDIDFKKEKYAELKDDNEKFKYVLLLVCKKLGRVIPQVFDGVTDYIDILIPDNLLNDTGFVAKVINEVPESNYNQVEIIGWLYQYYNQTEKDRVISAKKAYKKNEIPYATQLFTPDWIVKYMVENSLGRYWVEHNGDGALYPSNNLYPSNSLYPSSSITDNWKYFIKENIENKKDKLNPTEITFIDPCCGSGHILVYAFEVFYQIYLQAGYNKKDIPELILKNNLYGLDIDDRAGQLSILSVLLKAREYDRNIFNKDIIRDLHIISIQESNIISEFIIENISDEEIKQKVLYLIDNFKNAKEIGSLLKIEQRDYNNLLEYINNDNSILGIELREKIIPLIKQANILSYKYDVAVTNPPYMGLNSMNSVLKNFLNKNYYEGRFDLCTAFMQFDLIKSKGYLAMINQQAWMFKKIYLSTRKRFLDNYQISTMIHMGMGAFGSDFGTTAWVAKKDSVNQSIFIRLADDKNTENKEQNFFKKLNSNNIIKLNQEIFKTIPNNQLAYWITNNIFKIFKNNKLLHEFCHPKKGFSSGDNPRFIRIWYEIDKEKMFKNNKWIPITMGGDFRRWYGNNTNVVNYELNGLELRNFKGSVMRNINYYYKECISWNDTSSTGKLAMRYHPSGFIPNASGPCIYTDNESIYYILGLMNSVVAEKLMSYIAPAMKFEVGEISNMPFIEKNNSEIVEKVKNNIDISKCDWDSFETSWDFKKHPLIMGYNKERPYVMKEIKDEKTGVVLTKVSGTLELSYVKWKKQCDQNFEQLKQNEEELNKIFIDIYGLQDELTPEEEDKDVTIRKADKEREIKSLISHAVGCMFGRYSLDKDGLIYAGGDFDKVYKKYKGENGGWAGASLANYKVLNDNGKEIDLSFEVDNDNVIPITDEAYFGDDIVERFKKFISVVYGKETLNENLDFIAETLGKKGTETSEDTIRRYFVNDFFNDHVKIYQKRPIYWLFDSGKKNGFKALIYMHRYNENLVPKIRLDYLHRMQTTYEKLLSDINYKLTTELSMTDKKEAQKRQADLNAKLQEIKEYDEKIAHIANQRISIDLDDGVKVNYEKFKDILAKIK